MARIRTIKPAFFRDYDLFILERESGLPVRVAFAGLWTAADREGLFTWTPRELKLDCLPHDDVNFSDVLDALERGGFIRRYEVSGRAYGCVRSWHKHQRPRNDEEASRLPAPLDSDDSVTVAADGPRDVVERRDDDRAANSSSNYELRASAQNSDEIVTGQSLGKERKWKGKEVEGKGREDGATSHATPAPTPTPTPTPDEPVLLLFPTEGTPREWRLRRAQVTEWQETYPSLDVLAECRRALAWVKAKPGRMKTTRGMCAFLVNWFNRAVDNRRSGAPGASKSAGNVGSLGNWARRGLS